MLYLVMMFEKITTWLKDPEAKPFPKMLFLYGLPAATVLTLTIGTAFVIFQLIDVEKLNKEIDKCVTHDNIKNSLVNELQFQHEHKRRLDMVDIQLNQISAKLSAPPAPAPQYTRPVVQSTPVSVPVRKTAVVAPKPKAVKKTAAKPVVKPKKVVRVQTLDFSRTPTSSKTKKKTN